LFRGAVLRICMMYVCIEQHLTYTSPHEVVCTTHSPQPQEPHVHLYILHLNDITCFTLTPQHNPATTTQRCDTLRKGRDNPPPPRPCSQQRTSLEITNRLLTLLESNMLISDTVTFLFCVWLCNKLSLCHQPL
jgi:hypothetical protein